MTSLTVSRHAGHVDRALLWLLAGITVFVAVLATLPTPSVPQFERTPEGSFAVVDVTVFDGEDFETHYDVWIEQGRIKAVGRRLDLPDDLPRVDGRGRTLLPGLIDAHAHTFDTVRQDALRFGVTTVLDQFTALDAQGDYRGQRQGIGHDGGADLFSAGMLATAAGGHGTQYGMRVETLASPDQANAWVRERKREGSDWIKIVIEDGSNYDFEIGTLDPATVAALIKAAHAEGLIAVAHVSRLEDALVAVELGIDGLVHVWGDAVIQPDDATRLAEAGVFVSPTLSVIASVAGVPASRDLAAAIDENLLSPMQRETLAGSFGAVDETQLDVAIENVRRLHEAGVRILAGTDAPNPGTASGLSMHAELALLAEAGLASQTILTAATSGPAQAYGMEDRGRIAVDKLADLLLVAGDLREGLEVTREIIDIWKDGELVTRELAPTARGEIAIAPAETMISDFEDGLASIFGIGWFDSTDAMRGGQSVATLTAVDGSLRISGEVKPGFPFPWAGAIWFPGSEPMEPLDFGERKTLRFRVRGDPRRYAVMIFGETLGSGVPPSVNVEVSDDWESVEIPLDRFGVDGVISAVSFVAQMPHGPFSFEIDDVEIR